MTKESSIIPIQTALACSRPWPQSGHVQRAMDGRTDGGGALEREMAEQMEHLCDGGRPPGGYDFKLMKGAELNQHVTHEMRDKSQRDTKERGATTLTRRQHSWALDCVSCTCSGVLGK